MGGWQGAALPALWLEEEVGDTKGAALGSQKGGNELWLTALRKGALPGMFYPQLGFSSVRLTHFRLFNW